ncbi:hypothetical protein Acsp02_97200 [Actinoplanes sp. NBRC 103695]|nr:hypothetical protein Acsp02_97200 [Actinoplanes sp. NBRC 103695]
MTSRLRFISAHRPVHGVKRLCRVLAVSRSGFYRWLEQQTSPHLTLPPSGCLQVWRFELRADEISKTAFEAARKHPGDQLSERGI